MALPNACEAYDIIRVFSSDDSEQSGDNIIYGRDGVRIIKPACTDERLDDNNCERERYGIWKHQRNDKHHSDFMRGIGGIR